MRHKRICHADKRKFICERDAFAKRLAPPLYRNRYAAIVRYPVYPREVGGTHRPLIIMYTAIRDLARVSENNPNSLLNAEGVTFYPVTVISPLVVRGYSQFHI